LIKWKSIGYEVVGKTNEGREKKAHKLKYHLTLSRVLLENLYPCFLKKLLHNYVSRWHDLQFKECLENLPPKTILSYVDFSKNTMKIQNEVQSMHWHNL
jgi:hypothetical protein